MAEYCCEYAGTALRIKDYADSDFTVCSDCTDASDTAWDGKFEDLSGNGCLWEPSQKFTINGKRHSYSHIRRLIEIPETGAVGGSTDGTGAQCAWAMYIRCFECSANYLDMWVGHNPADSPVGIYRRVLGCDTTKTVEVELDT